MITCKIFFWQCASFLINMAILFLSSKWATTVPNKLIDGQYYKQLRRKTLTAFHSLLHFTLTTTWLNLSFLKTLNYSKTIQYWYYLFATPTDFIQTWQKLRQLFGKKFISNQWPIWNFQMRLLTMQNLSFHSKHRENDGTQEIHYDHWSLNAYLRQCHLLHNLHLLQ